VTGVHEVEIMTCSYCVECDESRVSALCVVSGIIGKFYDTAPHISINISPENNLEVKYLLRNQEKAVMSALNEDFIFIRNKTCNKI
jgi:hypothetical protein